MHSNVPTCTKVLHRYNRYMTVQSCQYCTFFSFTGTNPMDNLKVQQLRAELQLRGVTTEGKKKPELEKDFEDLRRGITNVPALLQGVPHMALEDFGLSLYEVAPIEPLHDIKGHLCNLLEEIRIHASLSDEAKQRIDDICSTALVKETLRGSDYRKGAILILLTLLELQPDSTLTTLLQTAVEITEMLYSDPRKRTTQTILRLHNLCFVHAKLCMETFSKPKSISSRKMFGRHFHALTTHAPLLHRIISLRLLNAEAEERLFGQCKAITRNTSNQQTHHIITNILVRLSSERQVHDTTLDTLQKQESEVYKVAQALPPKHNTIIPLTWLQNCSVHYQAHLERISDYLLLGKGMWWDFVEDGIEFFDISHPTHLPSFPILQHFRSVSMADVDLHLLSKWEQCVDKKVELPASILRTYTANGSVSIREIDGLSQQDPPLTCATPSLTPCSSNGPGQLHLALPLTPCSSNGPGQQNLPHSALPLTPCSSNEPGQQNLPNSALPLTPCSSNGPGQTHSALPLSLSLHAPPPPMNLASRTCHTQLSLSLHAPPMDLASPTRLSLSLHAPPIDLASRTCHTQLSLSLHAPPMDLASPTRLSLSLHAPPIDLASRTCHTQLSLSLHAPPMDLARRTRLSLSLHAPPIDLASRTCHTQLSLSLHAPPMDLVSRARLSLSLHAPPLDLVSRTCHTRLSLSLHAPPMDLASRARLSLSLHAPPMDLASRAWLSLSLHAPPMDLASPTRLSLSLHAPPMDLASRTCHTWLSLSLHAPPMDLASCTRLSLSLHAPSMDLVSRTYHTRLSLSLHAPPMDLARKTCYPQLFSLLHIPPTIQATRECYLQV